MPIQKLRLQRGWSQEQLAELSGLSPRTIQRIEKGQTASLETLKALAAVFELDVLTLQEPDMTPTPTPTSGVRADEALAFAHVRKVKAFYVHLAQYVIVMAFLVILNLFTSPTYPWVIWPALGWGIGLSAHGLSVWEKAPFLGGDWERRQVEKRLGRSL